jgi:hypothetical protein
MNRYPLIVRGHGPQRRHGWRLHHAVMWICPSCTPTTGRRDLLWQTALMPVCLRCGCYLVRAGTSDAARPASAHVLELAGTLAELADDAIDNPRARGVLYRLRRRCQARAATITGDTSRLVASPFRPSMSPQRATGAPTPAPTPPPSLPCWSSPAHEHARTPETGRPAPTGEASSPALTTSGSSGCSPASATTSHHDGLRPEHVPSMLPPPMGRAGTRARCVAVADPSGNRPVPAHLPRRRHGRVTPEAAMAALGVPGIPTCSLIDARPHCSRSARTRRRPPQCSPSTS